MNTACIIAACVANSHNRNKQTVKYNSGSLESIYYRVTFKKYYYFKAISMYIPTNIGNKIFSPTSQILCTDTVFKTVKVPEFTFAVSYNFYVSSSKCPNGITKYIQDNLDSIMSYPIWQTYDKQVLYEYKTKLNKKYNTDVDSISFEYTTKYYWEYDIEKS